MKRTEAEIQIQSNLDEWEFSLAGEDTKYQMWTYVLNSSG